MSNTTIKGFMNFPTQFADGTVIGNEDGGPAFLQSNTVGGVWTNSGPPCWCPDRLQAHHLPADPRH